MLTSAIACQAPSSATFPSHWNPMSEVCTLSSEGASGKTEGGQVLMFSSAGGDISSLWMHNISPLAVLEVSVLQADLHHVIVSIVIACCHTPHMTACVHLVYM